MRSPKRQKGVNLLKIKVIWVKQGNRFEKEFATMEGTAGAEAFMAGLKDQGESMFWWEEEMRSTTRPKL